MNIILLADYYYDNCKKLLKLSKIKKLPNGKYIVMSETGKNLGTYKSRESAKKRLKQVEYFKHFDHSDAKDLVIDLTDADEFAYSAIVRKLREKANKDQVLLFLKTFKNQFDKAIKNKLQSPEKVALQNSVVAFNKIHKIKLSKELLKNASVSELGSAKQIGKYLSDIVRFIIARMPIDKRQNALEKVKNKFYIMPAEEISSKNLPDSAAIGQSITFVKHVLFNHDTNYIKEVLTNLVKNL
jgi:hypothetical protein